MRQYSAFATMRRFASDRRVTEHCEFCSATLGEVHSHVVELSERRIVCVCEPCALLFSRNHGTAKYRRVPRQIRLLTDFRITSAQWESLQVPINLAFFFHSSAAGKVVALYPSPAGATESQLEFAEWNELADGNPALRRMEPDVEGLLANRIREPHEYYLAPIDECFKLVGLIRTRWRGLSGGTEAWGDINHFFEDLKSRSTGGTSA